MKTEVVRLQFVEGTALSSRVIAWFSAGQFSHVDCLLDNGTLLGARNDWHGSIPPGVRIRPPSYLSKHIKKTVLAVPCTLEAKERFHNFLYDQIGKPYDQTAIMAFFFNRNWRDESAWFCSELQTAAGEHSMILPKLLLAPNKITPVACATIYSARGAVVQESK